MYLRKAVDADYLKQMLRRKRNFSQEPKQDLKAKKVWE